MNNELRKQSRKELLENIPRESFLKRRIINIIILIVGSLLIAASILLVVFTIPNFTPHKSHYLVLGGVTFIFLVGFSFSLLSFKEIQQKIINEEINVKALFLFFSGILIMILSLIGTFIAYLIKNIGFLYRGDIVFASIAIIVTLIFSYGSLHSISNQIERVLEQTTKSGRSFRLVITILLTFLLIFIVLLCIMFIFLGTDGWFIAYIG